MSSHSSLANATRCPSGAILCVLLALAAAGCSRGYLESSYGRQQHVLPSASVNGTDVLAGMFSEAGHEVFSRRVLLSSEMASVDTIVWFPDDFAAPRPEVCQWFDNWLGARPGRTAIYVGRDFDAAPLYWEKMIPLAPEDQRAAYRARKIQADFWAQWRAGVDAGDLKCDWFEFEKDTSRDVHTLSGPWARGLDVAQTEIRLGAKLVPADSAGRLLTADEDVLVAEISKPQAAGSRLILVANGSFLLNLPLVNQEHRKLSGALIAAAEAPGRVVFLESGPGGPPIDPPWSENSVWQLFGAWPLNAILLHLAVLGIIFCFARWPIFGRPQTPPAELVSDFGKHVEAVGELLHRTHDRNFALGKIPRVEAAGPQPGSDEPG